MMRDQANIDYETVPMDLIYYLFSNELPFSREPGAIYFFSDGLHTHYVREKDGNIVMLSNPRNLIDEIINRLTPIW